jgi:CheY-like chemotaxis protein
VVDDNKVNRLLLTRSLELQGTACDGRETAAWRWNAAARALRLLLLDMEMPEMDGFTVLGGLMKDPAAA